MNKLLTSVMNWIGLGRKSDALDRPQNVEKQTLHSKWVLPTYRVIRSAKWRKARNLRRLNQRAMHKIPGCRPCYG